MQKFFANLFRWLLVVLAFLIAYPDIPFAGASRTAAVIELLEPAILALAWALLAGFVVFRMGSPLVCFLVVAGLTVAVSVPYLPYFLYSTLSAPHSSLLGKTNQFRVLSLHGDAQENQIAQLIQEASPDFVASFSGPDLSQTELSESYPWSTRVASNDGSLTVLMSKRPFQGQAESDFGLEVQGAVVVSVAVGTSQILIAAVEALSPFASGSERQNELLSRRLGIFLRHTPSDVILIGDFKSSPNSRVYRRFEHAAYLSNAAFGFGLSRTWDAQNPFIRFVMDHVLYRGGMQVTKFSRLILPGSSHFPLLVDFAIPEPTASFARAQSASRSSLLSDATD